MTVDELIKNLQTLDPNISVRSRKGGRDNGTIGNELCLRISNHKYHKGCLIIEGAYKQEVDLKGVL